VSSAGERGDWGVGERGKAAEGVVMSTTAKRENASARVRSTSSVGSGRLARPLSAETQGKQPSRPLIPPPPCGRGG
jgi:hypothetical protein